MSCGVGRRRGSDLALLWLWHKLAGVALLHPKPGNLQNTPKKTKKKKKEEEEEVKKILRKCYEQCYANKLDNVDEMDRHLGKHKLLKARRNEKFE